MVKEKDAVKFDGVAESDNTDRTCFHERLER